MRDLLLHENAGLPPIGKVLISVKKIDRTVGRKKARKAIFRSEFPIRRLLHAHRPARQVDWVCSTISLLRRILLEDMHRFGENFEPQKDAELYLGFAVEDWHKA